MSKSKAKASRRRKRAAGVAKSGPVWRQTAEEATLAQMPRYNAHACGTGPHGDTKYNRAQQKRDWQRELKREGARSRGFLPFSTPAEREESASSSPSCDISRQTRSVTFRSQRMRSRSPSCGT